MSSASRLVESKSKSPSEVRLVEVLDAYMAAAQEGRAPGRDELLAEYPELAEDLEACLASLEFIRQASLTAAPLVADTNAAEAGVGETGIGELGDFRLVAEVGRGGMGVVYEAVQRSLNRRVALKVLPFASAMDPTQLRRFQTEALAAAQLHHTHIVPVYSVGCERGVHYYAMQFIEGQTLAQAIAERRRAEEPASPVRRGSPDPAGTPDPVRRDSPASGRGPTDPAETADPVRRGSPDPAGTPDRRSPISDTSFEPPAQTVRSTTPCPSSRTREFIRTATALGIQAAEALDHAHKVGIVHRDIKPANLMLDVQGSLWVTDFGLARLQDDAGLTITGDLVGTLRYMSPEQALAKRMVIDHRTDIYSLGATLYELVTLRAAIEGQDRQEVLRKIAHEEPQLPRRLNPSIPRELETILLKAMEKEPESRYTTAQELADDLRRFLEDKPIKAKRPTVLGRSAKWARRHPSIVMSAILLLAMTATGLAIGSMLLARKQLEVSRQRDRANELAQAADAQRALAEQNARLARKAVDEMFTQVAEKWLAKQPRLEAVQRDFLEKALRSYEELSIQGDPDPAARQSVADALQRIGEIRLQLGLIKPAEDAFRESLAINLNLAGAAPADLEVRYRMAKPYLALGRLFLASGKPNDAADAYRRAKETAQILTDGTSGPSHYRLALADADSGLGLTDLGLGRLAEAERALRRAIAIEEKLVLEDAQNQTLSSNLANDLINLSAIVGQAGHYKESESACRRAVDLRQRLLDQSPGSKDYQDDLASSIANLGLISYLKQEFGEAQKLYHRALSLRRKLVVDFPRVPDYHKRLAEDLDNLAAVLRNSGKPLEAEPFRREAVVIFEGLVRDYPDLPENRAGLGDRLSNLGVLLNGVGKKSEAEVPFRRAMEALEPLIVDHPEIPSYFIRFTECATARGEILIALGRIDEAETVFRRTLDLTNRFATRSPKVPRYTEVSIRFRVAFGEFLKKERRDVEARETFQQALDKAEAVVREDPQWALGRELLAWVAGRLSKLLSNSADPKVREVDQAVALAAKAVALEPDSGDVWNVVGEAHFRARHWDEAITALKKAGDLRRNVENVSGWYQLAMAYWEKGDKEQARQWYGKASTWMETHKGNDEFYRLHDDAGTLMGVTSQPQSAASKEDNRAQRLKP